LKVVFTPEAIADVVGAIEHVRERSPKAAANLDAAISDCVARLADREFDGPTSRLRSGSLVQSWPVAPFRIYYQRHPNELLIVRMYHQARRPITR
jgi:plasmid stabilization system protein ParE